MTYFDPKRNSHANLSIIVALFAVSNAANATEEFIPIPEMHHRMEQHIVAISPFDSILSPYQKETLNSEKIIIENFLNKILNKSKDLDGDIVDLINKHFWDLI